MGRTSVTHRLRQRKRGLAQEVRQRLDNRNTVTKTPGTLAGYRTTMIRAVGGDASVSVRLPIPQNDSRCLPELETICAAFDLSIVIVGRIIFFSTLSPLTIFNPWRTPSAPGVG